jgi:uncharacterized protein GlcG (DUF336 family)
MANRLSRICCYNRTHHLTFKRDAVMITRSLVGALSIFLLAGFAEARAQDSLMTYKSLAPSTALELAQAALADCQKRGY